MNDTRPPIRLRPARLVRALAAIAVFLVLAHVSLVLVKVLTGHDRIFGLVRLFDLDRERNIPNFFSGSLFLLNALLLLLVAKTTPRSAARTVWRILAGLFVFLAFDEMYAVHERLTKPLREAFHTSGLLYYAWVVVYVPAVVLIACVFVPVWRRLDTPVRSRLGLAAGTYLAGAVGLEAVEGAYREAIGPRLDLTYGILVVIEESLEMAGLIILTQALLSLLERRAGGGPLVGVQDRD